MNPPSCIRLFGVDSLRWIQVLDLGICDYISADKVQRDILTKVKSGALHNALILAEFTPVYTIGRKGASGNLLVSEAVLKKEGIEVHNVNRGGDITAHNPGQLIAYPIFNLAEMKKDIDWYLRSLEELVINLLFEYGISGERKRGFSGVWVGERKIAFVGIAISRWVTYHGLSLNVNNDLSIFDFIVPCGIKGCEVTSIARLNGSPIRMAELKYKIVEQFRIQFNANCKTAVMA